MLALRKSAEISSRFSVAFNRGVTAGAGSAEREGLSLEPGTWGQLTEAADERRRADREAEARSAAEARLAALEAKLGSGGQQPPLGSLTQRAGSRGPNGRTTPSKAEARVCDFRSGTARTPGRMRHDCRNLPD